MKKIKIIKDIELAGFSSKLNNGDLYDVEPKGRITVSESEAKALVNCKFAEWVYEPEEAPKLPEKIDIFESRVFSDSEFAVKINAIIDYLKAREVLTDKK